jgi:TetR/AcrR family transcriptional regulator, transcriptional repressor for nem operon
MSQVIQRSLSEEILDKTMTLFWEKGYFNTSIDDITVVTGFNRAAIYKYFGGKDQLFLAMLERFRKNVTDIITIPLQNKNNGLQGIKAYFTQFIELYDSKNLSSRGCFLVTTAIDIQAQSKQVSLFIQRFLNDIRTLFRNLLIYARDEKCLNNKVDIESVVDFLVGNLFGLMSLCRSSAPKQIFENHIGGIENYIATLSA